jgi:KRAB domain-containing zinc finger protein
VLPIVLDEFPEIGVKEEFLESPNYHVDIGENNVKVESIVVSRNQYHKDKQFKCSICDGTFKTFRERKSHFVSNHKGEKQYKCSICDDKFQTLKERKSHLESNHKGERPYKCPICESRFSDQYNLKEHISQVHVKNKPFMCDSCPSAFARPYGLGLHIREVHKKLKPLKCDQCTHCFSRPFHLKEHILRVHEGKKPEKKFCCDVCGSKFEWRTALKSHIKLKHVLENKSIDETNINEFKKDPEIAAMIDKAQKGQKNVLHKEYVCKLCNIKVLFGKNTHIKKYHSGNNIKCPKCDKTYNTYVLAVNHHINMHERSPCLICGKFFSSKTIGRHMQQAHTANDDKKYKCDHCGKGFVANDKLQDHINTHTGEKPHVCKVCGKGFASLGTHKMHERMHAGYRRTK